MSSFSTAISLIRAFCPLVTALLGMCALAGIGSLAAESSTAEVSNRAVRLDGTLGQVIMDGHAAFLLDPSDSLTRDDISRPEIAARFTPHGDHIFNQTFLKGSAWLRVELDVTEAGADEWFLVLGFAPLDRLEIYPSWIGGALPFKVLGDSLPFAERDLNSRFPAARLLVPAGRHSLLLRASSTSSMTVPLSFYRLQTFFEQQQGDYLGQGIYFGMIFAIGTLILAVFVPVRDIAFVLCVTLMAVVGSLWACLHGIAYQYLWPHAVVWNDRSIAVFMQLAVLVGVTFFHEFLRPGGNTRLLQWVLLPFLPVVAGLLAGTGLLGTDGRRTVLAMTSATVMAAGFATFLLSAIYALRGYRPARFLSLGGVVLTISTILGTFRVLDWIPSTMITLYAPQLGGVIEIILLCCGLAGRVSDLRRAKEAAQRQALSLSMRNERELERLVADRTRELNDTIAQLTASERRFRLIVESAPFPLIITRAGDDDLLFANQHAADLFGVSKPEAIGLIAAEYYFDPLDRQRVSEIARREGYLTDYEIELKKQDGTRFWVLLSAAITTYEGVEALLVSLNDISRRRELESGLIKAKEVVEASLALERSARDQQNQFVAMISHEFRTPLSIIDSAAQNIEFSYGDAAPEARPRLEKIRRAVKRMINLIDTYLTDDRIDGPRLLLRTSQFDLALLLDDIADDRRAVAPKHVITIDLASLPAEIGGDRDLLAIAFSNLLENAVKYSPPNSRVTIKAGLIGARVQVSVADRGVGVSEADRELIFDKYFRASNTAGTGGAGLGLYLVRRIVEAHGGTVAVNSPPEGGSIFIVTLPLARMEEPAAAFA